MFEYLRAACAVIPVSVADTEANCREIEKKIDEASGKKADILVFPELCLTGYTCADLFYQSVLQESAEEAMDRIVRKSESFDGILAVGSMCRIGGELYNGAYLIYRGKVVGIVPKSFLPNYNEFYEKRWFSPASNLKKSEICSRSIGLSGEPYSIPVGTDLILNFGGIVKVGAELCEDLWAPLPPSTLSAMSGAEVIVNLSASNEVIAKRQYRRTLISQQSGKTISAYLYASAGSSESTTDLIFSGSCLIAENGTVLCENEQFIEEDTLICGDIDLERLRADRRKNTSFSDCAAEQSVSFREIFVPLTAQLGSDGSLRKISKLPFVPDNKQDRLQRCMEIFEMQVAGLKKRLTVTKSKVVVGVSGGLDSTLALLVAAQAMKELGRPVTDILGVTMPCFGTSGRTHGNSVSLMEGLGVSMREVDIREACTLHCRDIGHDLDKLDVTFENVQARERTQILMDISCEIGGFVLGTGDLSELALGWCTYNADHMSMYNVNCTIPKSLIRWMISSVAQYDIFHNCTEVLLDIINTPISPELLPPDEKGNIAQETESIVGPYALHDFFLYYMLRYGFRPAKIYDMAQKAFAGDFSAEEILKWMKKFYWRFFSQQYKRSCVPDGVKVGSICLSPRGDWRMPSDASSALWMKELDSL